METEELISSESPAALQEQGREILLRYLSAPGNNKDSISEEIKRLPGKTKSEMLDLPEFKIFIRSYVVDALLGTVSFSKGQSKLLELMLSGKLRYGISPMGETGPIEVEAEGA